MLPDRVSNPGPLTYESGALPIRNVCNSFPILPETCAKTIGQNVKHSIKAVCICCRMMIHLQG